jgi:N-acyl-D-aspartate/D-glutamate deacylase
MINFSSGQWLQLLDMAARTTEGVLSPKNASPTMALVATNPELLKRYTGEQTRSLRLALTAKVREMSGVLSVAIRCRG